METAITNASNTPALETLYTYTTDRWCSIKTIRRTSNIGDLMSLIIPAKSALASGGYAVDNSLRFNVVVQIIYKNSQELQQCKNTFSLG